MNTWIIAVGLTLIILGGGGIAGLLPFAQVYYFQDNPVITVDEETFLAVLDANGRLTTEYEMCTARDTEGDWKYKQT